jgi:hypothetical protein
MAKVSIRKEELDRVLQVAERTAKRTNERVVVALDRVELQDSIENNNSCGRDDINNKTTNFY